MFRRRFRVPWPIFVDLAKKSRAQKIFGEKSSEDTVIHGKICPIEIKLLGVLRILGRNWSFDDVAEATGMGETTVRRSFMQFTRNFAINNYDSYVYKPEGEKLIKVMNVYSRMGLPGCVGSTDVVHVKWDRCPVRLYHLCKGKEGFPTLAYSVVVDHHRRILSVTQSNWGARNDKTMVKFDDFIMKV